VFGGAIVTEQIFRIPGIGSLLIDAILRNDTPVIMAVTFVSCLVSSSTSSQMSSMAGSTPASASASAPALGKPARHLALAAEAWRRFKRHRLALFWSLWVLALIVLAVLLARWSTSRRADQRDRLQAAWLQPGRLGPPAGHRRPGTGPAGAHALRRAHLAGRRPGGDADGHLRSA
jgi:hypothetical protein